MAKIIQKDNKILRQVAEAIPPEKITDPKIKKIIKEMKEALGREEDGVAIAAPQIGVSLRIFVVSGKVLSLIIGEEESSIKDLCFINPKIIKVSKRRKMMEEGCLSARWLYGRVSRSEKVTIEGYNEKGEFVKRGAGGILSQIFQHEIDHLDGILFTDKAEGIENLPPPPKEEEGGNNDSKI